MTDISDRVRSLLELAEKATPGPWRLLLDDPEFPWVVVAADGTGLSRREDAELIVAAVNLVPALAQEWEATRAALERIVRVSPRGCSVIYADREKGWTCLDEQARARTQPERYSREYGEAIGAGERLCIICVARAALSAGVSPQPPDLGGTAPGAAQCPAAAIPTEEGK